MKELMAKKSLESESFEAETSNTVKDTEVWKKLWFF